MAYYFPTTNLSLSDICSRAGQTAPYSLGAVRGKTIYTRSDAAILLPANGSISMDSFKDRTFTVPSVDVAITSQSHYGQNYDSVSYTWAFGNNTYTINGGTNGYAGFNTAVAKVTDTDIISLTINFWESSDRVGASTSSYNLNQDVFIRIGGVTYNSSMGTKTFTNLSGTTLVIHVYSEAQDRFLGYEGSRRCSLGGEWTYSLSNRTLTLTGNTNLASRNG
jgi:hypothetical protein